MIFVKPDWFQILYKLCLKSEVKLIIDIILEQNFYDFYDGAKFWSKLFMHDYTAKVFLKQQVFVRFHMLEIVRTQSNFLKMNHFPG